MCIERYNLDTSYLLNIDDTKTQLHLNIKYSQNFYQKVICVFNECEIIEKENIVSENMI